MQLPDTFANTLVAVIKDALRRCNLTLVMCGGQAFDGAANMQGLRNGVAAQIQVEVPSAIPVYCLVHCLVLVLREAGRKYRSLREALETVAFSAVLEDYVSADNGRYKRHHTRRVWTEGKWGAVQP